MYSFDVNSLFTNISLKKTNDIPSDHISLNKITVSVPLKILKDLLLLCTDKVLFSFESECFR